MSELSPESVPNMAHHAIRRRQPQLRHVTLGDIIGHERVAELNARHIAARERAQAEWDELQCKVGRAGLSDCYSID